MLCNLIINIGFEFIIVIVVIYVYFWREFLLLIFLQNSGQIFCFNIVLFFCDSFLFDIDL